MNSFYCFNCQKEVEPKSVFGLRFCPHCGKRIADSGEGFYLICNNCGANNPTTAGKCIRCGSHLNTIANVDENVNLSNKPILSFIVNSLLVVGGIAFSVLILYISFYLMFALFVFGVVYLLLSKVRIKL